MSYELVQTAALSLNTYPWHFILTQKVQRPLRKSMNIYIFLEAPQSSSGTIRNTQPIMALSLVLILLWVGTASTLVARQSCHVQVAIRTFYGYPDNDPPGAGIAYDCGRGQIAGGTGTFNDPLTFATAPGEFETCEIIYDPYLRKYLRMEDYCESCNREWGNRVWHIDVWTGSNTVNGGNSQVDCEVKLTPTPQDKPIVRRPGANLAVDTTPLYVMLNTPVCNVGSVFPSYVAQSLC
ncbi:hypothetical protein BDV25DRAFT_157955 [Aspergillus avenaceus]|uniref:Uncharacterized protein n=1 Tax=Aspergillus avenaceus TaxID=36643 RepID=A0A5N6TQH7_ASPAV|nr:hypothetical protein BDV25DRAFT_157955 [Aspergillus avenaceus]